MMGDGEEGMVRHLLSLYLGFLIYNGEVTIQQEIFQEQKEIIIKMKA